MKVNFIKRMYYEWKIAGLWNEIKAVSQTYPKDEGDIVIADMKKSIRRYEQRAGITDSIVISGELRYKEVD